MCRLVSLSCLNKSFIEKILGRTSAENVYGPKLNNLIVRKNEQITSDIADQIIKEKIKLTRALGPVEFL